MIFQLQINQDRQDVLDFNSRFCNVPSNFRNYNPNEIQEVVAYLRSRGLPNLQARDLQIIPNQTIQMEIQTVRNEFGIVREVRNIINSNEPLVITIRAEQLNRLSIREASALQMSTTNICLISLEESQTPRRNNLIRHEVGHYFDNLIHGDLRITFNDIYGDQIVQSKPQWLVEGLNELRTARTTSVYTYKYETLCAALLEHAVGEETLRRARITGDFREVQRIIDQECGIGTFEQFIGSRNAGSAYFILSRNLMRNPNFNVSNFENDRIVRLLLELISRPEPEQNRRAVPEFEFVAQSVPQRTQNQQEQIDLELSRYPLEIRSRFTNHDLDRIRTQTLRLSTQNDLDIAVEEAIIRTRPDLVIQRRIHNWNTDRGRIYGEIDSEQERRLLSILGSINVPASTLESRYNRAELEFNILSARKERDFRIDSSVNSIIQYCTTNQIDVPQRNELIRIGIQIADNRNIRVQEITPETIRLFRGTFPNLAAQAEANRYAAMGIIVPIVTLEGEQVFHNIERGEQEFRYITRPMIETAREILTAPLNQTQQLNGNITIAQDYPLSMTEMFSPQTYNRLLDGEIITQNDTSTYYNRDIDAIIIETQNNHAIAFFNSGGEITQIRAFVNRPIRPNEARTLQRRINEARESNRVGNGAMLREVLSRAYETEIITDIGLRRIGEWDIIRRNIRRE